MLAPRVRSSLRATLLAFALGACGCSTWVDFPTAAGPSAPRIEEPWLPCITSAASHCQAALEHLRGPGTDTRAALGDMHAAFEEVAGKPVPPYEVAALLYDTAVIYMVRLDWGAASKLLQRAKELDGSGKYDRDLALAVQHASDSGASKTPIASSGDGAMAVDAFLAATNSTAASTATGGTTAPPKPAVFTDGTLTKSASGYSEVTGGKWDGTFPVRCGFGALTIENLYVKVALPAGRDLFKVDGHCALTIRHCELDVRQGPDSGKVVKVDVDGRVLLEDCTIAANGMGIEAGGRGQLDMKGGSITSRLAIAVDREAKVTLDGTKIVGQVFLGGGKLTARSITMSGEDGMGCMGPSDPEFVGPVIELISSQLDMHTNALHVMKRCTATIKGGSVRAQIGAIRVEDGGKLTLEDTVVEAKSLEALWVTGGSTVQKDAATKIVGTTKVEPGSQLVTK